MAIPTILKGETAKPIELALKDGYDYAGCSLHVDFCRTRSTFVDLGAGGSLELRFTAEQTAGFPLGTSKAMLSLENAAGEIRFMPWVKIKVTDSPADLYDAQITIDPATLDVDDLTEKDSLGAVKTKLQAVIDFLRSMKVLALVLVPLGVLADVAPLYTTPNEMPGDAPLMTNTAAYVDAKVAAIPAPDFSTNNTALVETIEATAPAHAETDPVWNAEKGGYATKADVAALAEKDVELKQDIDIEGQMTDQQFGQVYGRLTALDGEIATATNTLGQAISAVEAKTPNNITRTGIDATLVHADGGSTTNLVYIKQASSSLAGLMTAADKSAFDAMKTTVAEHEAAIQAVEDDNEQTRLIVTTWENFLDGSNVVFSITNYLSGAYNLDAAKMTIKELREGEYREVYNSRDEIMLHIDNFRTNDFRVATNQVIGAVNAAILNKADRDWGKYTSAGGDAPENTVYMTAPNTVFAGGLEYERVAVGEGSVCVLTTRGAPVWTQGDEGTFKFQDDGGTNYFGFAKTDSYTIGANTDGITVSGGVVTMNYNITMSGRPCVWYKADLTSSAPWEQLNLPDGSPVAGASHAVTWEQNPPAGTQVCYINVGSSPQGFFRATVEVAGEAKFMTNMPADLSGGIICTNTATGVNGVIKPTFNGSNVIWNWSAK